MGEKIFLTAKQARDVLETSQSFKNHIYKAICESSKDCRDQLSWDVYDIDHGILNKVVKDLKDDGYNVDFELNDDNEIVEIIIKW